MDNRATTERSGCVRERLIDTADRLFYEEGIRAVGIDRILREAGAAKASLYSHFGCKDALVAEHVRRRSFQSREAINDYLRDMPPQHRLLGFFDWIVEWAESPDFHGCPLQHVKTEICDAVHPAHAEVEAQRRWMSEQMQQWCKDAGIRPSPERIGALLVLLDGAAAASEIDGPQRARQARWAAEQLLRSAR